MLYRSIFDAVRNLLHDGPAGAFKPSEAAFEGHDEVMANLKPDLLILDIMPPQPETKYPLFSCAACSPP